VRGADEGRRRAIDTFAERSDSTPAARPPAPGGDLLRQITESALDADYARVAAQRPDRPPVSASRNGAVALAALLAFGLLMTVAALQVRAGAPQEERERAALLAQITKSKADFATRSAQLETLRHQVAELQGTARAVSARDAELLANLGTARMLTGAAPATGPGLRVVVDDAPGARPRSEGAVLDVDLQLLVNGLWQAGAEAVAVNGNRLSPLSAIRGAGSAITVNYRSLSPPYEISAIGDLGTLEARFVDTAAGQTWLDLKANFGLRFDVEPHNDLSVPAAPTPRLQVRYAQLQGELP
jgi:uncharacterized protein YlxW (UPF0749 family)